MRRCNTIGNTISVTSELDARGLGWWFFNEPPPLLFRSKDDWFRFLLLAFSFASSYCILLPRRSYLIRLPLAPFLPLLLRLGHMS